MKNADPSKSFKFNYIKNVYSLPVGFVSHPQTKKENVTNRVVQKLTSMSACEWYWVKLLYA